MLVPTPTSITPRAGSFVIDASTAVRGPAPLVALLRRELGAARLALQATEGETVIELGLEPQLPAEVYRLEVGESKVRILGGDRAGVFYAIQTLRQLLPPDGYRRVAPSDTRWELPALLIEDAPRFSWRGAMLDVGRHFMPLDFLFRWVDLLAMHKLNVLHLHLTEDQGWRFESRRYPKLQGVGSWRPQTLDDGTPHGGYYRQDDLRELVAYAAERSMIVVPEIDMPGHMRAAIAAYPELGNHPEQALAVGTEWGIEEHVLSLEMTAVRFCHDILDEVLDVFPSQHVHIGGDECPTREWAASDRLGQLMRERGVTEVAEYQRWFTTRIWDHLADRARTLVGWDEIVDKGPVPGAVVMGWRSAEHCRRAAALGQQVILAPQEHTYFNFAQSADPTEPGARRLGRIDLAQAYAYEPLADLPDEAVSKVLGTQFQIWTEQIPTPRVLEYQAFPRACAFAEKAWSAADSGYADFLARLADHHLPRLDALGVNYRPLAGPRPWQRTAIAS